MISFYKIAFSLYPNLGLQSHMMHQYRHNINHFNKSAKQLMQFDRCQKSVGHIYSDVRI